MTDQDEYPQTPPRLKNIHTVSPVYFVTFCTHSRQRLLENETVHDALIDFSRRGFGEKNISVGRYVVMPDHIHLFVRGPYDFKLSVWVNQLKGHLTKTIRSCSRSPVANASRPQGDCYRKNAPVWQRGFFDHVLRSHESYSEKWQYVAQNPVRAGLVENADEWSYAGCITEIRM
ncbi:MAG TPA: transposase [Tichowtungia sp.]|nr:transposase [Tichowtungia sp.]